MLVFLESCLMVVSGILLLRISGRKSLSQMTIGTTAVMLMLGTLLANPIATKSYWATVLVIAVAIATLIVLEVLQLKSKKLSNWLSGSAIPVIEDGQVIEKNLRKTRIPRAKLEMRLRLAGIDNISKIKLGTIEANGNFGYELMPDDQPLSKGEFRRLFQEMMKEYVDELKESFPKSELEHSVHFVDKEDLMLPRKHEHEHDNIH